jgi:hypothetical protein
MDKPISVGDLVVIVRECCGVDSELGSVFRVSAILTLTAYHADGCGYFYNGPCAEADDGEQPHGIPLHWLKRIPPLSELEGEKRDEKIKEPA